MAVFLPDLSVAAMDNQFRSLIPTDLPGPVDCVTLGAKMPRGPLATGLFDIPTAAITVGDDVRRATFVLAHGEDSLGTLPK